MAHVHLVDALAVVHSPFQPHECPDQRRTVALHGAAEPGYLHLVLHSFDGCDGRVSIDFLRRHGIGQRVAHAIGVDEHHLVLAAALQKAHHVVVVAHAHIHRLEMAPHLIGDFVLIDENAPLTLRQVGIGYNHRREGHIGAAQVECPGYLVEGGDDYRLGTGLPHGIEHPLNLALHILAGKFLAVHIGLPCRARGPVGPDVVGRAEVGGKHESIFAAEAFVLAHIDHREQPPVECQHRILGQHLSQPLGDCGLAGHIFLEQRYAAALQLLLGLQEIAAVGPQPSLFLRDNCRSIASRKARDPVTEFPILGRIFTLVGVGAGYNHRIDIDPAHCLSQGLQMFKVHFTHLIDW